MSADKNVQEIHHYHHGSANKPSPTKNHTVAVILAVCVGPWGIDRFYLGHYGVGIAKLFTLGGLFVWWAVDVLLIALRKVNNVEWDK
jgi:TM2 domain-containing membrane protein YozV